MLVEFLVGVALGVVTKTWRSCLLVALALGGAVALKDYVKLSYNGADFVVVVVWCSSLMRDAAWHSTSDEPMEEGKLPAPGSRLA